MAENSSNFMKQLASSCYFTAALAIDHGLLVTLTAEGLDVAETSPIIVAVTKHITMPVQTVSMICIPLPPITLLACNSPFTIFGAKMSRSGHAL